MLGSMSGMLSDVVEKMNSDEDTDERLAIVADGAFTYRDLDEASRRVAVRLLDGRFDLEEARVAYVARPGFALAALQRGIWIAGGVAVPLAVDHPPAERNYVVQDAGARLVDAGDLLGSTTPKAADALPLVDESRRAMIVYTSGTTGRPKGVVTTHANIRAQVASLVEAWGWARTDRMLLALPMHHVHGILNGLGCPLAAGASCEMLPRFDAEAVWARMASGDVTVFTGVPTMYQRLIAAWDAADAGEQRRRSAGARGMRLMMAGSAALPVPMFKRWQAITGHALLERYGMTEIGMALSNPLDGERRPGAVGVPLPGVEVRLMDEQGRSVVTGEPGEIQVRGASVFLEYWQRPDATRAVFQDGWFRTGDIAVVERGAYRMLGRSSVDIIKTGGFKVSALEVEAVLRRHPAIAECAVVGVEDPEWGERVSVAVELRDGAALILDELRGWARAELAPYKVPRALVIVVALPRNAMGKVTKPDVKGLF
jgi:malonyl-CoA/methylmalonyl-CoA synthetase